MATAFIRFVNILIAALLAGTSFGIWLGLNPLNYSAPTYIEQQQNLVLSLNILMVTLVFIATLVTSISAYLQRKNKVIFFILLLAAVSFAACIVISRFGNLPIQNEMLTWTVTSFPENWTELRDKWWSFHIARTIAELIGLVLVTLAAVVRPAGGT
jgi:hypothetical protein